MLCTAILVIFLQQNHSSEEFLEPITIIPLENEQLNTNEQLPFDNEEISFHNVIVDIKGEVKYPGVYELTSDKRVIDVIELAGGYTDDADSKGINHAQRLQDEMVIYIPKTGDSLNDEQTDTFITVPTTFTASNLININLANESDLLTLPGIGPSKAQAIITYRDENGRFQSIEDLKKVSGIGDKTFEKLKEFITIKQ
ncbi:hypothetical protein CD29_10985 [Ureibacillus manganicus DSM 26584]|uniref:Helix-hairpin-helix DNA-binding motif class 1 domain-containing protein n=2 Tax=Ureibacillus TaxID=160795 RepID=A0A0A3I763_9BACL|nr:hypothetical protein CD29_10985 [Ureibacillus manganicus DSM 26584]